MMFWIMRWRKERQARAEQSERKLQRVANEVAKLQPEVDDMAAWARKRGPQNHFGELWDKAIRGKDY